MTETPRAKKLVANIAFTIAMALFLWVVYSESILEGLLRILFPNAVQYSYDRTTLFNLLLQHVALVVSSSVAASIVGIAMGLFVTSRTGHEFLPFARAISSLAQTFPPSAVLALIAPLIGFGFEPTFVALFIFSILPVINNTIAGIESIPQNLLEVSRGVGMTGTQVTFLSKLPLAARVIVTGIRSSVVINIGTATVGAVIGAGGLGVIIIAGLVRNNPVFVFSGALVTTIFALLSDSLLGRLERLFFSFRDNKRSKD